MADTLIHRGPDDSGVWSDMAAGVGFGYRRLAIVDVSQAGHQPMRSGSGRWTIIFNGEIYNFTQLRHDLDHAGATPAWRGHSDTEVFLAAIDHWGLDGAIDRAVGMFAFALWDQRDRVLHLVRDRVGEKPLYYGLLGGQLVFASELKALRVHPNWRGEIRRDSVAEFMHYGSIAAPRSIYEHIAKLPAGCILSISQQAFERGALPEPRRYWSMIDRAVAGQSSRLDLSDDEAASLIEARLADSIRDQMRVDVPLGAFLSGGIDSALTVALMQAQSSRAIKTFTVGFAEADYDEAPHAAAVARHLGTDHTELYLTAADAMSVIPSLPIVYDEPFADSSQIPTLLVAELARRQVTVCLSGDGGDELFGGYQRYGLAQVIERRFGAWPHRLRRLAASTMRAVPTGLWDRAFPHIAGMLSESMRVGMPGDKIHKFAQLVATPNNWMLHRRLNSMWPDANLVLGAGSGWRAPIDLPSSFTATEQMMLWDTLLYLPDDILAKVDRASMRVSLETRMPLLDHRLIELAARLPERHKMQDGVSKRVLRSVLYRHVPRELVERPKMGFGFPLDHWLRGPLASWVSDVLDPAAMRRDGYLAVDPIMRTWEEHRTGRRNWPYPLWNVLMFQVWLAAQRG